MDRVQRRPVMIVADLGRALVVAVVPVAAAVGVLHLWLLFAVALAVGMLSMFFRLGWVAYLPLTVGRDRLVEGTSALEAAGTAVGIAGPGVGGLLVQALTAPVALVVDAASFLVSAINLTRIRTREAAPQPATTVWMRAQLAEGFRFVRGHLRYGCWSCSSFSSRSSSPVSRPCCCCFWLGRSGSRRGSSVRC